MSASDKRAVPSAIHAARVVLACRDQREFQRDFLPRYCRDGVFVATPCTPSVGERIRIKVELLDSSIGYAGEAVVAALDREGLCPGIRVLLKAPASSVQATEPSSRMIGLADGPSTDRPRAVAPRPEMETLQVSIADLEIEPEVESITPQPSIAAGSRPAGERTGKRQPQLAERLEVLAASALRVGDLEAAEAHCRLAIRADPERVSLRILLRGIETRRQTAIHPELAQQ